MKKIKILVFLNANNGCILHRLLIPYTFVHQQSDDIDVEFYPYKNQSVEEIVTYSGSYDFFAFHSLLPEGLLESLKEHNVKTIFDIDDYWVLSSAHPLYKNWSHFNTSSKLLHNLRTADYVTTTTELLKDKILPYNDNVYVFPNALVPFDQFIPVDMPHRRLRFGLVCGSSHTKDIELLDGIVKALDKDVLDKIQFVLCGFDEGISTYTDENNNVVHKERMDWKKNCWTRFESILTNNYTTISPEYKEFLDKHIDVQYPTYDEPYRRIWTKSVAHYAEHYDYIDVLMIPLVDNEFNKYKSELKMVEASVKGKAVIVSDVEPYHHIIRPFINCIPINNKKRIRGWAKAITRLVNDPSLLSTIIDGNKELTLTGQPFNLVKVTDDRISWLKIISNE